ncbi:Z1 domain-containing protein [Kribbella sp. NBC_00889]|uniref:Z1 domain-containing protein n=1 Tax=Kribbella sp. NBC_00889 TaxID=2975974 RepID=UPI0038632510|nr:Z1 domain-containing protein [Kribbella sp. NBC_00889]
MTDSFAKAYLAALAMMDQTGPDDLHPAAAFTASRIDPTVTVGDEQLRQHLRTANPNDALRMALHLKLATWDAVEATASWAEETAPHSAERRSVVVRRLKLDDESDRVFTELFPVAGRSGLIVIADQWEQWYVESIRDERDFYWKNYSRFLHEQRGWAAESVASLDVSTDRIVERLSDPTRAEAYQAKGLVVGYVQSGKTANFTGVLAKAVDAGYRLIIVLTGTTDLLRAQTQRRLDLELVGRENILRGIDPDDHEALDSIDYQDDPDWLDDKFIRHAVRPSDVGKPDIHRLTTQQFDYRSLKQGIAALDFERRDRTRPFYDAENLLPSDTRLLVVKKNATVLKKLVQDLHKITARLGEIPALIIDDESDQASVNTSNPKKWTEDQKQRTAINRLISQILKDLPRAQYVGYTATPFANVFIDPSDAEDIFPRDFLISLDRPTDYMGAVDFHDIDSEIPETERTPSNSRKKAHVRLLPEDPADDDQTLLQAIDVFVLAGAVKVYREKMGVPAFRHHTMLVHENMKRVVHTEQAARIKRLWTTAGYYSASSHERLRRLFEADILPVSRALNGGSPVPPTFEDLAPHISDAVTRIASTGNPVLIVNSDQIEGEDLDFDKQAVWRILVGGNKLARGFTVEGLTVSYYRRVTKQADTLMQMGRWFGYRRNFRDLVRLYITSELYEGFEAICRDEEHFRAELRRYADLVDGRPQITPKEIPPLVAQHLPWLKPTAANKMYNAILTERRSPGVGIEPTGYPEKAKAIRENVLAFRPLLEALDQRTRFQASARSTYEAHLAIVSHAAILDVLDALTWVTKDHFAPDLRWLRKLSPDQLHDWAAIFPQHVSANEQRRMVLGHGPLSLYKRERRRPPYFGAIRDPKHLHAAKRIAGLTESLGDAEADRLVAPRRGSMVVYPVIEKDPALGDPSNEISPDDVIMAFHLIAPGDAHAPDGRLVTFTTRDNSRSSAAIIDTVDKRSSES